MCKRAEDFLFPPTGAIGQYRKGYENGYERGKAELAEVLDKISAEIEHEKGKWDYLSSDTCFDIAIGVVKRYEKEAEGKEVDG